jgi:HlyD family secretion protein
MLRKAAVLAILLTGATAIAAVRLNIPDRAVPPGAPESVVRAQVMALGRIEPVSEIVRIAAPAAQDAGRIAEILIREGDPVERGQILALLDTHARLAAALQQAEATLAVRKATLAKLVADLDNQEKTLSSALEQQEAQRDRSQWDYDRLLQLQKSGLYREAALIDKRLALEGANQALETARLMLERNRRRDANGLRVDEASLQSDIAVAEAALARAKADHEFSAIRSPIEGRVLRRLGRLGEQIGQAGFAEIGDTRVMMVRAEVFESDLRRIRTGRDASVFSRALDQPLRGTVDRIGLKVDRQTMIGEDPAATLDARVIEVLIRLDGPSSQRTQSLSGLQVRVSFSPEAEK